VKIDRYVNNIKDLGAYNNVFKSVNFNLLPYDFVPQSITKVTYMLTHVAFVSIKFSF